MKVRLDELILERGFCNDIKEAQALIMAGRVLVKETVEDKPGMKFPDDAAVRVKTKGPFVSRGGLKLERAMEAFSVDVSEAVCMDIGCSTGGFTHVLLKRGAQKIYAVDVGSGQLDWRLRNDPRVVVMEKTNIRNVHPGEQVDPVDFICVDVSFISIRTILPNISELLKPDGKTVFLIKPQFEAARNEVGEGGIVRDETVRERVIEQVNEAAERQGLQRIGCIPSPITGAKGNVEYLAYYKRCGHEEDSDHNE